MKRTILLAFVAAFAAGCTTVQYAEKYNGVKAEHGRVPIATVEIENSGWFLLGCIPLASGNPEKPGECSCRFFKNTVTLQNNCAVLERTVKKAGATSVVNLTSHWTDESAFMILLKRRACHTSAVLLKAEEQE